MLEAKSMLEELKEGDADEDELKAAGECVAEAEADAVVVSKKKAAGGASAAPARTSSPSPRPRAPPSHILGRPGPGEPSGFLVVPGRAEGVARPGLR